MRSQSMKNKSLLLPSSVSFDNIKKCHHRNNEKVVPKLQ